MKSLQATGNKLADTEVQLGILEVGMDGTYQPIPFQEQLLQHGLYPLKPTHISTLQVNVGKMCNQVCKHCHVDAGPDRKEIMTVETMQACLAALDHNPLISIVDLTGGAPEMNPNFRWFVEEIKKRKRHIIVRCNLTIIVANKKYNDLPQFYKEHGVEVVSSLPFYSKERTNKQRGDGVFEDSITALRMLNEVGYGVEGSELKLNLVYNPAGAFLPPDQQTLEADFKKALYTDFGIVFNELFAITNMPISRYLDYLLQTGNYDRYMERLTNAFNPAAATNVMCRSIISVGWDGYLYDCDFNQILNLKVSSGEKHISQWNQSQLNNREIVINQHCYGCAAGSGSSCGGAVT
ncbi:MAG: arsenosugar biosynthesis radical SAM protein ArsS [Chitinophagaceae bacterium]|nr:arsenosugar biosynthesis radical SAM protein ArsS [Chitinophagaceae bacterium]